MFGEGNPRTGAAKEDANEAGAAGDAVDGQVQEAVVVGVAPPDLLPFDAQIEEKHQENPEGSHDPRL